MDRRTFLAATASVGAVGVAPVKSVAASSEPPVFANPLDREVMSSIACIERCAADMRAALIKAQTSGYERGGYLFDMRVSLGTMKLCEDHISQKAWEQAVEDDDRYRNRNYRGRYKLVDKAIVTLRRAGWSWRDAADVLGYDHAEAVALAAGYEERERAGNWNPRHDDKAND